MNKQELIEKYKTKGEARKEFPVVAISDVLKDLRELDELEKVKVPEFVAEYIKYARVHDWDLHDAINFAEDDENENIRQWMYSDNNIEKFCLTWILGYEVEKEKRYRVKVKGIEKDRSYLAFGINLEIWFFTSARSTGVIVRHTRKQLEEAGFGWMFSCEGIEVEEVE